MAGLNRRDENKFALTQAWYLLVSIEKALAQNPMDTITTVKGVDLNRRNIAVESSTRA